MGGGTVTIKAVTCDVWAKDKTFDYYALMMTYK